MNQSLKSIDYLNLWSLALEEDIHQMKLIRGSARGNTLVNSVIEIFAYIEALFEDGKGWVATYENQVIGFSCGRGKQCDAWALFIDINLVTSS